MNGLLAAMGFLTVLPVPLSVRGVAAYAGAAPWFPVVGLVVGGVVWGASRILAPVLPPVVLGGVLTALWAGLTGFLHLDGLADSCDALFVSASRERRLEILRDPRVGAYGATGLILLLLLKAACLSIPTARVAPSLFLAAALARGLAVALSIFAPARSVGMGREFIASVRPTAVGLAAVPCILIIAFGGLRSVFAALLAVATALAIGVIARRRLGGMTGDVLGLAIEVSEAAALSAYSLEVSP